MNISGNMLCASQISPWSRFTGLTILHNTLTTHLVAFPRAGTIRFMNVLIGRLWIVGQETVYSISISTICWDSQRRVLLMLDKYRLCKTNSCWVFIEGYISWLLFQNFAWTRYGLGLNFHIFWGDVTFSRGFEGWNNLPGSFWTVVAMVILSLDFELAWLVTAISTLNAVIKSR